MGGTPVRLFCLPYSGASAMTYSRWRRKLPAWLAVRPVELPGRGARMAEPLQTDLASLAQQLARELHDEVRQGPYAMLGHSLGALLACEVLYALRELGCPTPLGFFACGTAAPSRRAEYDRGFAEPKSDAELIADLRDLQGFRTGAVRRRALLHPSARGRGAGGRRAPGRGLARGAGRRGVGGGVGGDLLMPARAP